MTMTRQELKEELVRWVDKRRDEIVEETARLLSFQTVSGGKSEAEKATYEQEVKRCLEYLGSLAERLGLAFRNYDNLVAVIERKGDTKALGILLHIDVVPAGEGWTHPPFGGVVADDTLWGRGTQDDKGPVMSCLYGLAALQQLGLEFSRTVKLVIGTREEIGEWDDMRHFLKVEGPPEFSFTPDANFPIINGEKGMLTLVLKAQWRGITPSPMGIRVIRLEGGERVNIVPNRAILRLRYPEAEGEKVQAFITAQTQRFLGANPDAKIEPIRVLGKQERNNFVDADLVFLGKSAHGSLPYDGHNAILDALKFIAYLELPSQPLAAYARLVDTACSDLFGSALGIAHEHHFIGKTTVNLGILRLDERGAEGRVNVRHPLGLTIPEIVERATRIVEQNAASSELAIQCELANKGVEPLFVDPEENRFFISCLQEAYETITGKEPRLEAIGGTTFAKAFPNTVSFGPVMLDEEKELAHQSDEHISIEHLLRNTRIYGYAIALLCTKLAQ
jgi:succinyl-diaminopimelate desuccinylase